MKTIKMTIVKTKECVYYADMSYERFDKLMQIRRLPVKFSHYWLGDEGRGLVIIYSSETCPEIIYPKGKVTMSQEEVLSYVETTGRFSEPSN